MTLHEYPPRGGQEPSPLTSEDWIYFSFVFLIIALAVLVGGVRW